MWSIDLFHRLKAEPPEDGTHKAGGIPVVLYNDIGGQSIVMRACRYAQAAGIRIGMAVPLAQSMAPQVSIHAFDAVRDFHWLCRLAHWALAFSPLIAIDTDLLHAYKAKTLAFASSVNFGLILDITGTERLHGGDHNLAQLLLRRFLKRKIEAQIAVAPTIGAAWALSRYADSAITLVSSDATAAGLKQALSPLPPCALRISEQISTGLHELGITTIGQLMGLPQQKLGARFGAALINRINQALGHCNETLHFAHFKQPFSASRRFEIPLTSHESIKLTILALLKRVFEDLLHAGKVSSSFVIEAIALQQDNSPFKISKELSLHHAGQDLPHLNSVIQPLLESFLAPQGICFISITARLTQKHRATQTDFSKPERVSNDAIDSLLDHLTVQLGQDSVMNVSLEPAYEPQRAVRYYRAGEAPAGTSPAASALYAERPSYLFNNPEPVSAVALLPDSPPAQIRWKGQTLRVVHGIGPERISKPWWQKILSKQRVLDAHDYFRVQDQHGRWLWISRNKSSLRWFVHGMWC